MKSLAVSDLACAFLNNGSIKSPVQISASTVGERPQNATFTYWIVGSEGKELASGDVPISPSDATEERRQYIVKSATFKNSSGGNGSVVLEKTISAEGGEEKDSIVIPIQF